MKFSSRGLIVVAALTLGGVWLWRSGGDSAAHDRVATANAPRSGNIGPAAKPFERRSNFTARPRRSFAGALISGHVRLANTTIATDATAFDDIEVVFNNPLGETSTMANADGSFEIELAPGAYHVMARGEHVMTTVLAERDGTWMPGWADVAAAAAYAPALIVTDDVAGVDVTVTEIAKITGHVLDASGRPIVGATVHSLASDGERGIALRPAFGTDIGISDEAGAYELLVPAGEYQINATHPYFGMVVGAPPWTTVAADAPQQVDLEMMRGCVIAGHVLNVDGTPAQGGHIEISPADNQTAMRGAATIGDDGTFQWTGMPEQPIALRGWSWRSAPSPAQIFACRDGARFEHVVFQIPPSEPSLDGTLTGADGEPLVGVKFEIVALSENGQGQIERTDSQGNFAVYAMPAGEYEIIAATADGAIAQKVTVPSHHVSLTLGQGTIEATVKGITDGSIKISMQCSDGLRRGEEQIVHVRDGKCSIVAPACKVLLQASSAYRQAQTRTLVGAAEVAHVQLDLTPARRKLVSGVITNAAGLPAAGVTVQALASSMMFPNPPIAVTDRTGRYTLETASGAFIIATSGDEQGGGEVTWSEAGSETIDIRMEQTINEHEGCGAEGCDTSGDMEYYSGHGANDESGDNE